MQTGLGQDGGELQKCNWGAGERDGSLCFDLNSGRIKKRNGGIAKSPKGRLPMDSFVLLALQR